MRALILGATSLIGNNVLRQAIEAGWETVVFDQLVRRRRRHPALEGLSTTFANGSPDDPEALRRAMGGCQVVFHTAGYSPPNSLHHRRRLTEASEHIGHVLQAAGDASIERLVYTSAISTIGRSDTPTRPPDEWNRYRLGQVLHPYWDAKLVQESAVFTFGREKETPVVVLNPSEVIGPYDYDLQASRPLLEIARRGTHRFIPGKVSLADARDVAAGHIAAAERGRPGERYILAGHNLTRREALAWMARASKRPPPDSVLDLASFRRWTRLSERFSCWGRPSRPFPLSYQVEAAYRFGWYDSRKAMLELGYSNRPLINTFRTTLAWLKAIGALR